MAGLQRGVGQRDVGPCGPRLGARLVHGDGQASLRLLDSARGLAERVPTAARDIEGEAHEQRVGGGRLVGHAEHRSHRNHGISHDRGVPERLLRVSRVESRARDLHSRGALEGACNDADFIPWRRGRGGLRASRSCEHHGEGDHERDGSAAREGVSDQSSQGLWRHGVSGARPCSSGTSRWLVMGFVWPTFVHRRRASSGQALSYQSLCDARSPQHGGTARAVRTVAGANVRSPLSALADEPACVTLRAGHTARAI